MPEGVLPFPLDGMLVHHRVTPPPPSSTEMYVAGTHFIHLGQVVQRRVKLTQG